MTKGRFWVSVVGSTIIALVVGGLFGWFVRGGWTADWVSAAGVWIGAIGTISAVITALGIAIRDGRIARKDREDRDARQARNVLAQPNIRDGYFHFTVTNWSEAPVRNVLLEDIKIAWKSETKSAGRPVYRKVDWSMSKRHPPAIAATPLIASKESYTFSVVMDTGMEFEEAKRKIGTYEITISLTDIETRRWRNINGNVSLVRDRQEQ